MRKSAPLTCLLLLMMAMHVDAQTQCPVGAQPGSILCLANDQQPDGNALPRPTGEWVDTWGAIAHSRAMAESGVALGKFSENEAKAEAIRMCAKGKATDCEVYLVFFKNCAAVVASKNISFIRGAPSKKAAADLAVKDCEASGRKGCGILFSGCSDPVFRKL